LQQAGILDFTSFLRDWWPVIFILIGTIILMNRTSSSTITGWLFILVGAILILNQFIALDLANLILHAIFIFIVLMFIFSRQNKKKVHVDDDIQSFSL